MKYFLDRWRYGFLAVLLGLSSLAVSLSPLAISSAHASSSYDDVIHNSDGLYLKRYNESATNITSNWYSLFNTYCSADDMSALASAMSTGSYVLVQEKGPGVWNEETPFVYFTPPLTIGQAHFTDSPQHGLYPTNTILHKLALVYTDSGSPPSCEPENQDTQRPIAVSNTNSLGYAYQPYIFGGTWNITYPDGYSGDSPTIVTPPKPNKYPDFTYTVSGLTVTAHYTGPQCIPGAPTADDSDHCFQFKLLWNTFPSGSTTPLDDKTLDWSTDYTFTYPSAGTYVVDAGYASLQQTPFADLTDDYTYIPSSVSIVVDGGTSQGSTTGCTVADGVCSSSNQLTCDQLSNFIDSLQCKFHNQMNVGIINPTIDAVKSVFAAFYVPSEPSCDIYIPNVPMPGGGDFDMATLGSTICINGVSFRSSFPLIVISANFVTAILIIGLLAGFINKLLNPNDHDIIQGMDQGEGFGSRRQYVKGGK